MVKTFELECDICGAKLAQSWRISGPRGRTSIDLCEVHAQPLEQLLDTVKPLARTGGARRGGRPRRATEEFMESTVRANAKPSSRKRNDP